MSKKLELQSKVGDTRTVRSDLVVGGHYGKHVFVSAMECLRGKALRVKAVIEGGYYLVDGGCCCWTEEMLEPIKPIETLESLTPTEQLVKYWAEEMQGMKDGDKFEVEEWPACCPYSYKNGKILDKFDDSVSFSVYTSNINLLLGKFKVTVLPKKVSLTTIIDRANKALAEDSLTKRFELVLWNGIANKTINLEATNMGIPIWDSARDDEITTYEEFSEMMYGRIMELRSQLNQTYKLTEWRTLNGSIG